MKFVIVTVCSTLTVKTFKWFTGIKCSVMIRVPWSVSPGDRLVIWAFSEVSCPAEVLSNEGAESPPRVGMS